MRDQFYKAFVEGNGELRVGEGLTEEIKSERGGEEGSRKVGVEAGGWTDGGDQIFLLLDVRGVVTGISGTVLTVLEAANKFPEMCRV